MAELEFNIARLQQCLDVTVGTPSVGDVLTVSSTSPLEFDFGPNGGGTGTVDSVTGNDPISVDNTDPANPIISIAVAQESQAGVVTADPQEWWGRKIFNDVPQTPGVPSNPDDITNKAYVDTFAAGLQVKAAVRAATLVAGTLASSFENGDIIDGVTLATDDRILIKNQASAIENGIYTVNASGAPTRATDYDAAGEANAGTFTTVTEGSQNNTQWVQVNLGTPDPGTDALNFSRLNISAAVSSIQSPNTTHGTGGTLTGAVPLDSTDIYYNGYSAVATNRVKYQIDLKAPIASPTLTGIPKAPTAGLGTNSTQIATTAFVQNALAGSGNGILTSKVSLTSAQILNCFTSPITLIAAPGVGKVIQLIGAIYRLTYNSSPYGSVTCQLAFDTSATTQGLSTFSATIITQTDNGLGNLVFLSNTDNLIENKALVFRALTSNPTGGNSPIDLYLTYRIVTL